MSLLQALPDYPAVRQVAEALWGRGEVRGAAVMVGAGFSRHANLTSKNGRRPPLWRTFSAEMAEKLYPGGSPLLDPLKLAEEYKAALGQHALDALIRNLVPDDQWSPSQLHTRFLALPWADVLTTNWDTLLERTPLPNPERSYSVVRTTSDIARTRAPRIVKLHGSLPSHTPFIFTDEDFRTYRRKFAPFVNLAQQVLLENELCLIGFSGDDPNFLQWSGWVRDQLGESARRIRLVGVLNLSPSRRQVLEQHNVSPIDLAPLVAELETEEAHRKATELFLDALWEAKPKPAHEWTRVSIPVDTPEDEPPEVTIDRLIDAWRRDRESYPGWLVAPHLVRVRLRNDGVWARRFYKAYRAVDSDRQALAISELSWRYEVGFWPLDDFMRDAMAARITDEERPPSRHEQIRFLSMLLSDTRHRRDWANFDRWAGALGAVDDHEAVTMCTYQRALRARDEFAFESLAELTPRIRGDDPVWGLRRASLYAALREDKRAAETFREVRKELVARRARERDSLWLLSREAWASWLERAGRFELGEDDDELDDTPWSIRYAAKECDPWEEVQHLDRRMSEYAERRLKDAVTIKPNFDAGSYKDSSKGTRFVNSREPTPLQEMVRLAETVGVPSKLGMGNIFGHRLARALETEGERTAVEVWLAVANLPSHSEGLIDYFFSRVEVARLDIAVVEELSAQLERAIVYGTGQFTTASAIRWIDDTRDYLEVLSRLVVRRSVPEAARYFLWGLQLAAHSAWNHPWLFEPLGRLLLRSLEVIPPDQRVQFAFEAVNFPLPSEKGFRGREQDWPELIEAFQPSDFAARQPSWGRRIAELIEVVRGGEAPARTRALIRLVTLVRGDALSDTELSDLAAAVWSRQSTADNLPDAPGLYDHVFLELPEPSPELAKNAFHRSVVTPLLGGDIQARHLFALNGSVFARNPYALGEADALKVFDACISWRAEEVGEYDIFGQQRIRNDEISVAIGRCITWAVLPRLSRRALGKRRVTALLSRMEEGHTPSLLLAAFHVVRLFSAETERVTSIIRRAVAGRDEHSVAFALIGIANFVAVDGTRRAALPSVFSSDVASMCAIRREPGLLQSLGCARRLLAGGQLTVDEQHRVIDGLQFLLAELDYRDWDATDPRTKSLTLIRAECVRLAQALREAGRTDATVLGWIEAGKLDPFPEVRFASFDAHEDL